MELAEIKAGLIELLGALADREENLNAIQAKLEEIAKAHQEKTNELLRRETELFRREERLNDAEETA